MNALIALQKTVTDRLPEDRKFKFMTLGGLWCKRPPPPIADSCLGRICQDGTCTVCRMPMVDKEARLQAVEAFHEENQCCAICDAAGKVAVPGLGVEPRHDVQLRGRLARACLICRAQAAADGHSPPGLCRGPDDEGCEYKNWLTGTNALCYQCQCLRSCPGVDGVRCPHAGFRNGTSAHCYQCLCSRSCPGVDGVRCPHDGSRHGASALCYQCQCSRSCPGVDGVRCPHAGSRDGTSALCYQCGRGRALRDKAEAAGSIFVPRPRLSTAAKEHLIKWCSDNPDNLHPNSQEKKELADAADITVKQVSSWCVACDA